MTRAQALIRLQAVCDKKGWQFITLRRLVEWEAWYVPNGQSPQVQRSKTTLAALVAAFEERARKD